MRKTAAEQDNCDLLNMFVEQKSEYSLTALPPSVTLSSEDTVQTSPQSLLAFDDAHYVTSS